MQRKLRRLTLSALAATLCLGPLAASLPAGRVPTAIDYSAGQLRLRGLGLSLSEIGSLGTQLAARGYNARGEGDLLLVQAEAAR